MANAYNYSSTAVQTTLSVPITSGTLTFQVGDTTGWPVSYPYVVALDYGAAGEELVKVTGNTLSVLTVTRAFNGTSAVSHSTGAVVRHVYCAQDATDFRTHEAASTAVHGVTGAVVGTSDAQTLSNKTYNGGVLSGTFTGGPTFSGSPIFSGTTTFNAAATFAAAANLNGGGALAGTFTGAPTLSGAVVLSGGPNVSNGGTLSGTFAGTPTFSSTPNLSAAILSTRAAPTNLAFRARVSGDTNDRWNVDSGGTTIWGSGSVGGDTNLYRGAVGQLKTDTDLVVVGSLSAANFPSTAWQSFTPTWTAATTNPVLGNGTLTGYYQQYGKTVTGYISLTIGSTTTFGTGAYRWATPVSASANAVAIASQIGAATANPVPSALKRSTGQVQLQSATNMQIIVASAHVDGTTVANSGLYALNAPDVWATPGNLVFNFTYEAA